MIFPLLSEEDRAKVVQVMKIRGADCYDHLRGRGHLWHPYASHSNRAWHWLGEMAIAFQDNIPEASDWLDYAMTIQFNVSPRMSHRIGTITGFRDSGSD